MTFGITVYVDGKASRAAIHVTELALAKVLATLLAMPGVTLVRVEVV